MPETQSAVYRFDRHHTQSFTRRVIILHETLKHAFQYIKIFFQYYFYVLSNPRLKLEMLKRSSNNTLRIDFNEIYTHIKTCSVKKIRNRLYFS